MKRLSFKTLLLIFMLLAISCAINACSSKDDKKKNRTASNSSQNTQEQETDSEAANPEKVMQNREEPEGQKAESEKAEPNATQPGQIKTTLSHDVLSLLQKQSGQQNLPSQDSNSDISEQPQIPETNESDVAKFNSLTSIDEKINFLSEIGPSQGEFVLKIVDKAMSDPDSHVRLSAIELLAGYESPGSAPVFAKALKDPDEQVRLSAVNALADVKDPEAANLLSTALQDQSENVRATVLAVIEQQDTDVKLNVLQQAVTSSYPDVKENAVPALIGLSNPDAVDILISGLKSSDAEFRGKINEALSLLVSKEFNSYEEAVKWWNENQNNYDEDLAEKTDVK